MKLNKTLVTVIINSLFCCYGFAQNWAPAEAVWRYNFVTLAGRGYIQFTVGADTLIDNINCKQLNKRL